MNAGGIPFWKTETIGNDFVLIHAEDADGLSLPELATAMCDRRFGIGSDGLLVISPKAGSGWDVDLRMFNPDGSEDFCGNGLRCAAHHARRQGWQDGQFRIRQFGQVCQVEAGEDGTAKCWLAPAVFDPAHIPVLADQPGPVAAAGVEGIPVSTGSAHFIVFVRELPDDKTFHDLSPQIENHPLFPDRVSVMWTLRDGPGLLRLRIWERGAGETLGCGTGSSAAAAAAGRLFGDSGEMDVINPGGLLKVELLADGILSSSQPRERFEGVFHPAGIPSRVEAGG